MRLHQALLTAVALAFAGAAPAQAQDDAGDPVVRPATEARVPNFFGVTGLLVTPSAYVQTSDTITPFIGGNSDFFAGGVVGGIADRLEVGFSVLDADDRFAGGDTEFLANAKFQLLKETDKMPAFSVGVVDAFDEINQDPGWFIVASKYFTRRQTEQQFALKGHVGYGDGIFDEEVFGGAELFFGRNLSAMAEIANGDFNLGARYTRRGFAATFGLFDFDRVGGSLSYTVRFR